MPLLIPYDASGLDGKLRTVIDDIVSRMQIWAGKVDGINAAERLNELATGLASLPTVQVGTFHAFGGTTAPTGYLLCNGAAVSRTTYANLFAVIATAYGAGDGSSTFNVPDFRQRFLLGKAASGTGATLGASGGAIDHTHTGPSHTHTGPSHTHTGPSHTHGTTGLQAITPSLTIFVDNNEDGSTVEVVSAAATYAISGSTDASGTGNTGSSGTGDTGSSGTGATGTNNPPYAVVNWIVKT